MASTNLTSLFGVEDNRCAGGCGKTTNLQMCSKCKTVKYCSKDCQKANWKAHKKLCPILAQVAANKDAEAEGSGAGGGSSSSGGSGGGGRNERLKNLETHIDKPFHKLDNGTWLHDRSEKDVFQLLIDSFRLRLDDEFTFQGHAEKDSIYDGSTSSSCAFERYLRKVERKQGFLPSWWNDAKAKECVSLGLRENQWADLRTVVTKSGIIDYYGSSTMPMQLRMFAEEVLGSAIGGTPGKTMRKMQMMQENGGQGMQFSHLNLGLS